jgi:serine protease AprX
MASSLSAAQWHRRLTLPSNIHPVVAAMVRQRPHQVVDVIVSKVPGSRVEEEVERHGIKVTARWSFINSFAATVPGHKVGFLATMPGVRAVLADNPVVKNSSAVDTKNLVNAYNYSVRADKLWSAGYNGKGITVAILDSGIDTTSGIRNDFGSRVLANVKINTSAVYVADKYGHGTHVAAIVAGDGTLSSGKYVGIAPGVNLLNVKFSDDEGKASEKDLVNGLQWVYDNREKYNIRVVNISSNVAAQGSYRESPTAAAVEALWFAGVVVIVSSGNRGGEECSVCYSPANDPFVISVGAIDDSGTKDTSDDYMKNWSSYGTTLDGHSKPELVAPGARIVAYMPGGALQKNHPSNVIDKAYFRMGGTSMAAPVVSGVVALVLQVRPNLTPDEVKWLLMETARSYKNQVPGTGGLVTADTAAFWTKAIGRANQGLEPSPLLAEMMGSTDSNTSWANTSWANTSWANTSWANTSWANAIDF